MFDARFTVLGLTQGLTVLVVILVISILLHIIIITLLLTVDFISIIKVNLEKYYKGKPGEVI